MTHKSMTHYTINNWQDHAGFNEDDTVVAHEIGRGGVYFSRFIHGDEEKRSPFIVFFTNEEIAQFEEKKPATQAVNQ